MPARIELTQHRVTWNDFQQPHRNGRGKSAVWDYAHFGPFVIERAQYEAAYGKQPTHVQSITRNPHDDHPRILVSLRPFHRRPDCRLRDDGRAWGFGVQDRGIWLALSILFGTVAIVFKWFHVPQPKWLLRLFQCLAVLATLVVFLMVGG